MDLFFNELSALYTTGLLYDARLRMISFINLFKKAKQSGYNSCKVSNNFEDSFLCQNYSIHSWLNDTSVKKDLKDFYLSFRRSPYETGIENDFDAFYYLNEPEELNYNGDIVEGLGWAYVCDSLAVSFSANEVWKKTRIRLNCEKEALMSDVQVNHTSSSQHFDYHKDFIQAQKIPVLIQSDINPLDKHIHLSNDHGKDKLLALAKKLVNCPYVNEVPHSLEYDRVAKSFIRKIHPKGRIDVTLINEDIGYSMMVQTTGRNLRETQEIAKFLKDIY